MAVDNELRANLIVEFDNLARVLLEPCLDSDTLRVRLSVYIQRLVNRLREIEHPAAPPCQ